MKPISTKLFEFLKSEGVLDKGEEEIKLAKIKYRNEYIRNWEKSHFANKKLIKIWLTIDEYNEIKYCAKKYNLPISKYSKGIIMNENTGKIIIPEKEKLLSIAQRISITEFQLLRIGQREIANEIEQCSSELIEYLNNRI